MGGNKGKQTLADFVYRSSHFGCAYIHIISSFKSIYQERPLFQKLIIFLAVPSESKKKARCSTEHKMKTKSLMFQTWIIFYPEWANLDFDP